MERMKAYTNSLPLELNKGKVLLAHDEVNVFNIYKWTFNKKLF